MPTKIAKESTKRDWLCSDCHTKLIRDEKHDAYYCPHCDAWCEKNCDDKKCNFCKGRPKRPSDVTP